VPSLQQLFENNRAWCARILSQDPGFFEQLSHQQSPQYLWIGCSDSRVPANQSSVLPARSSHRTVANVEVPPT
jgi:carbonic anhydrase